MLHNLDNQQSKCGVLVSLLSTESKLLRAVHAKLCPDQIKLLISIFDF